MKPIETDYNKETLNEAIHKTFIYTDVGVMFRDNQDKLDKMILYGGGVE